MAVATYSDLKSEVATYLARTDLTSYIPDFITLCENRIYYGSRHPTFPSEPLRIRAMEYSRDLYLNGALDGGTSGGSADAQTVTTGATSLTYGLTFTFTAGYTNTGAMTINPDGLGATAYRRGDGTVAMTANDVIAGQSYSAYYDGSVLRAIDPGQVPLPSSFLGFRQIYVRGNPKHPIDYVTPEQMDDVMVSSTTGTPEVYTIEGEYIRFAPVPDTTYIARSNYYKRFAAMSADADTNWLLTNAPAVYLYGALTEAALFIQDMEMAGTWHPHFSAAVQGLEWANERDRWSGAALAMRTDTGAP